MRTASGHLSSQKLHACLAALLGAADAQYVSAGPAYSGSDSEWLEVVPASGLIIFVR